MGKWEEQVNAQDILRKIIAKRLIGIFKIAKLINKFDVELYFKLTEKITVYDARVVISLLDGSEVECEIE